MTRIGIAVLTLMGISSGAHAVIVDGSNGTQNTTAPGGSIPWNNVGAVGGASGVYLGDGWMLTAAHVSAGSVTFSGLGTFTLQGGTDQRLKNGDNTDTDLRVFKLTSNPALPSLTLVSSTPALNSGVTMIGYGRDRAVTQSDWNASWGLVPPSPGPIVASGYAWAATNTKRWGDNSLGSTPGSLPTTNSGWGDVTSIYTTFTNTAGTTEGQAAAGDSGGAMFDSSGRLVGVINATGGYVGQPAATAVFGNRTYAADIATYRGEILAAIPEPGTFGLAIGGSFATLLWRRRRTRC